ncbi:hypothetical protein [Actinocorallia populi]|uniref:hypothetical protein n=1 Tax=Actinocorallia populi TaxID=2079200 RepID=UPI000D08D235|nr:hypothetical protein [Actinocorallia populi]
MNNAARHVLGLVVGVVATPVALLLWCYGITEMGQVYRLGREAPLLGALLMVAGGVLLGVLCGSRISPLASLVPGVVLGGLGTALLFEPYAFSRHVHDLIPGDAGIGFLTLSSTGVLVALGVTLLAASVPPSRWRVMRKPPPVPYPQLPFTVGGPGQSAVPGQPDFSGSGRPPTDMPVAGGPPPAVPPPGGAPQPPPLPYQPGT